MNESQPAPDTQVGPKALGGGTTTPKRRGCLFNLLLILPAALWLSYLLVLLPAHQGALISSEQRHCDIAISILVSALTIWALASTMRGWRVLYTLPLWAGILFGTIVECRAPYFTPFDYMFRQTGQEEKTACYALITLGADIWPNDEGHVEHVLFHDLKVADDRLKSLKALPSLKDLEMNGRGVTDAALANLTGADKLESLELVGAQVSDAGLIHLKALSQLRELDLSGTPVTDSGLERLKELPKLEKLRLNRTQITDGGLERLKALKQLRELSLSHTMVTDVGLEHIKSLSQLQRLFLAGTQATDAGLEDLKGLTQLQMLALPDQVTDAGVKHLHGLTQLRTLWLNHTRVTDAGLEHLKGLSQLQELFLDERGVTDTGVMKLHQALPNCEIRR